MEGVAIARKVDLTLHHSYPSLKNALITMFTHCKFYSTFPDISKTQLFNYPKKRFFFSFFLPYRKLTFTADGKCNEDIESYTLTYQDKEGDWLLAGDVPWKYVYIYHLFRLYLL